MTVLPAALIGYAIGSAPISYGIVRAARGIDLRREGSGNVGATNVYRTSGAPIAIAVLLVDLAKGVVSVLVAGSGEAAIVAGTAAVVGHIYPIWLGFRGGKGVATAAGAFALIAPVATTVAVLAFVTVVAATRYVSLGSLVATAVWCGAAWWFGPQVVAIGVTVVAGLIVLAHRENFVRLWTGTERRFGI